jgi:hypothetical protein
MTNNFRNAHIKQIWKKDVWTFAFSAAGKLSHGRNPDRHEQAESVVAMATSVNSSEIKTSNVQQTDPIRSDPT